MSAPLSTAEHARHRAETLRMALWAASVGPRAETPADTLEMRAAEAEADGRHVEAATIRDASVSAGPTVWALSWADVWGAS